MKKFYLQAKGEEWEKARMRALVRDNFTCQAQRLDLPETAHCSYHQPQTRLRFLHVHHLQERQHGGTHRLDNLVTLCREHHMLVHPHMAYEIRSEDKALDAPPDKEL